VFLGDSGGILPFLIKSAEARGKSEKKVFAFPAIKIWFLADPGRFWVFFAAFRRLSSQKG
jgi:hypothetical protein